MMRKYIASLVLGVVYVAGAGRANADLVGTQVTGNMKISSFSTNYFDPAIGWVPPGPLNNGGTTVTIASAQTEFGYHDGANTIAADFTGTTLDLSDVSSAGSLPITYTFTDSAFSGLTLSLDSSNFPSLTSSLVGDVITINTGDFLGTSGTFSAAFNLSAPTSTPLPSAAWGGLCLLGVVAGLKLVGRRVR